MPRKKKEPYGLTAHRAAESYQNAVMPYHQVLEKLTLPKREPPGSEGNYKRMALVSRAMRATKWELEDKGIPKHEDLTRKGRAERARVLAAMVRKLAAKKPRG